LPRSFAAPPIPARSTSRAAAAAYLAYQRSGNSGEEAESLVVIGRSYAYRSVWRPALDALRISLELREVAEVRQQYDRLREDHGFRLLDYSVDADAASPRACFQFSEDLAGKRTDLSPFVVVGGQDKPALSAQDRQLCVEGLKHGERYSITLRAGIPSRRAHTHSLPKKIRATQSRAKVTTCAAPVLVPEAAALLLFIRACDSLAVSRRGAGCDACGAVPASECADKILARARRRGDRIAR
jgi:hypothetical protein